MFPVSKLFQLSELCALKRHLLSTTKYIHPYVQYISCFISLLYYIYIPQVFYLPSEMVYNKNMLFFKRQTKLLVRNFVLFQPVAIL